MPPPLTFFQILPSLSHLINYAARVLIENEMCGPSQLPSTDFNAALKSSCFKTAENSGHKMDKRQIQPENPGL